MDKIKTKNKEVSEKESKEEEKKPKAKAKKKIKANNSSLVRGYNEFLIPKIKELLRSVENSKDFKFCQGIHALFC